MKEFHQALYTREAYTYPSLEFIPSIHGYLHEDGEDRPAVIIVPGGGYSMVSPTEGEIVAKKFFEYGYQTIVVTYTTNMMQLKTLFWQPLNDLAGAVRFVRSKAKSYHVIEDKIAICGFSAGGHLCGSLAVHFDRPEIAGDISARPDAVILSYPVITSGAYAHRGSFDNLIGKAPTEKDLELMSLEKQVKSSTPPVFLWHTMTDKAVPVENSLFFLQALKEKNVICEAHFFPVGEHGLSLCNDDWANRNFGNGYYTMEQIYDNSKMPETATLGDLPECFRKAGQSSFDTFTKTFHAMMKEMSKDNEPKADKAIAIWPDLANNFLKSLWNSLI